MGIPEVRSRGVPCRYAIPEGGDPPAVIEDWVVLLADPSFLFSGHRREYSANIVLGVLCTVAAAGNESAVWRLIPKGN